MSNKINKLISQKLSLIDLRDPFNEKLNKKPKYAINNNKSSINLNNNQIERIYTNKNTKLGREFAKHYEMLEQSSKKHSRNKKISYSGLFYT